MSFPAIKLGSCLQLIAFCLNVLSASYWQWVQYYNIKNPQIFGLDSTNFKIYVVFTVLSCAMGFLVTSLGSLNLYKFVFTFATLASLGSAATYVGLWINYELKNDPTPDNKLDLPAQLWVGAGSVVFYILSALFGLVAICSDWKSVKYNWVNFSTFFVISGVFGTATSIGPFIPTVFGQNSFSFEVDTNDVFYTITLATMVASLVLGCLTGIIGINNRNKYLFVFFAFLTTVISLVYLVVPIVKNYSFSDLVLSNAETYWYFWAGVTGVGMHFLGFIFGCVGACCPCDNNGSDDNLSDDDDSYATRTLETIN